MAGKKSKKHEQRVSLVGSWVTATEHTYLVRLARLRHQSMSSLLRDLAFDQIRLLAETDDLVPTSATHLPSIDLDAPDAA